MAQQQRSSLTLLDLKLSLPELTKSESKLPCPRCTKPKIDFCPACLVPTQDSEHPSRLPQIHLPLKVHVLRGADEAAAKSTAGHAVVLAPEDSKIFYLPEMPHYEDPRRVLLLYPSPVAKAASQLPDLSQFDTLLVVDTTWQKSSAVMGLLASQPFTHVLIGQYETLFWRYQSVGPACLATIEATYFFLREYMVEVARRRSLQLSICDGASESQLAASAAAAAAPLEHPSDPSNRFYDGGIDALVLLFLRQYREIQENYTTGKAAAKGKAFTTKHRAGYIKGSQQQQEEQQGQEQQEQASSAAPPPSSSLLSFSSSSSLMAATLPISPSSSSAAAVATGGERGVGVGAASEGGCGAGSSSSSSSKTADRAAPVPPAPSSSSSTVGQLRCEAPKRKRIKGTWAMAAHIMSEDAAERQVATIKRLAVEAKIGREAVATSSSSHLGGSEAVEAANEAAGLLAWELAKRIGARAVTSHAAENTGSQAAEAAAAPKQ